MVLAALDDSATAGPVIAVAHELGRILDARVQGVHVLTGPGPVPERLTGARIPLWTVRGDVVDRIVAAGSREDVVAVTIGARCRRADGPPLGSTAVGVATALAKPVVVVPPHADPDAKLRRALIPLEGTVTTSLALRPIIELAPDAGLEMVVLHVLRPEAVPPFSDQPQHEHVAWAREFLHRYCRWGIGVVRMLTRVGHTAELVPMVARDTSSDLVVLGWSGKLAGGRAPVVRAVLEQVPVPVVLIPTEPG
jgi:nucleotide-binding universal stress UspA family protein